MWALATRLCQTVALSRDYRSHALTLTSPWASCVWPVSRYHPAPFFVVVLLSVCMLQRAATQAAKDHPLPLDFAAEAGVNPYAKISAAIVLPVMPPTAICVQYCYSSPSPLLLPSIFWNLLPPFLLLPSISWNRPPPLPPSLSSFPPSFVSLPLSPLPPLEAPHHHDHGQDLCTRDVPLH